LVTLTVWRFEEPQAAEAALARVTELARAGAVSVEDAALVSWPPGHRKPWTRELGALTGPGMLWGGFWGILLALIFLTPIAGPTFGAAAGAVAGSLADFGIQDDFVMRVRDEVTPGTSALFLVCTDATASRVASELATVPIRFDLTHEQERLLHEALGEERVS
jgi:uncharacterized membrane protein